MALGLSFIGAAFACALAADGWSAESMPGRPLVMRRSRGAEGEDTIEPFGEVGRMEPGKVDVAAWQQRCSDLGIRDLPLAPV
jgi:hypothetical protein